LEETGLFIEENLPNVHSFETRYALFDYILKSHLVNDGKGPLRAQAANEQPSGARVGVASQLTPTTQHPGLICEFGVATGKSINYLAKRLKAHKVYGFDSFQGLPETWRANYAAGTFKTPLPSVRENVELIPEPERRKRSGAMGDTRAWQEMPRVRLKPSSATSRLEPNIELVVGLFADTLAPFLETHPGPALLLHLDADLYSSTKTVLELMRPRIGAGCILIFDEFFNYPGWLEGEYKAFNEFIAASGLAFEYLGYNNLGTQLAVKIRDEQQPAMLSSQ
jgi:hypothetical protein